MIKSYFDSASLNQRLRDVLKNTGLKFSAYVEYF